MYTQETPEEPETLGKQEAPEGQKVSQVQPIPQGTQVAEPAVGSFLPADPIPADRGEMTIVQAVPGKEEASDQGAALKKDKRAGKKARAKKDTTAGKHAKAKKNIKAKKNTRAGKDTTAGKNTKTGAAIVSKKAAPGVKKMVIPARVRIGNRTYRVTRIAGRVKLSRAAGRQRIRALMPPAPRN